MAEVCPFRGVRYDQQVVGDLDTVVCPPYDVITPEQQKFYYDRNPYNLIRLECGVPTHDKYSEAARIFKKWIDRGVLKYEESPAFYVHDHNFIYRGAKRSRRGLLARVRLEPWGDGIYPHEETGIKDKSDRLQLLRACQANFSPLFALYNDSKRQIIPILSDVSHETPIMRFGDSREGHVVWRITDTELQQEISHFFSTRPIYMADGHHRYETALNYQMERSSACASPMEDNAYNYVMMALVEFADPGLVVFPLHRLVRGLTSSILCRLKTQLEKFFIVDHWPLTSVLLDKLQYELPEGSSLVVLGLEPGYLLVLRRRQDVSLQSMMPGNRSQAYQDLNISLLNHVILEKTLGFSQNSKDVTYTVDISEAYQRINDKEYQLAFLLSSPSLETIKAITGTKEKMPRKSTYFYPKLLSGLVVHSLG